MGDALHDYYESLNLKGSYIFDIYLNGKLLNRDKIEIPIPYFNNYFFYCHKIEEMMKGLVPKDSIFLNSLKDQCDIPGGDLTFYEYKKVGFPDYVFSETLYLKNKI